MKQFRRMLGVLALFCSVLHFIWGITRAVSGEYVVFVKIIKQIANWDPMVIIITLVLFTTTLVCFGKATVDMLLNQDSTFPYAGIAGAFTIAVLFLGVYDLSAKQNILLAIGLYGYSLIYPYDFAIHWLWPLIHPEIPESVDN